VRHTATCPTTAYFGELDGSITPRVSALVDAFSAAGFASQATSAIEQVEWEKLMQIGAAAGFSVSALAGVPAATFADGIAIRQGAEHFVALARDLLTVYRDLGYEPEDYYAPFSRFKAIGSQSEEEAIGDTIELGRSMLAAGLGGRASMHEDVLNGRPTEVEFILGPYVERARARGLDTPTLHAVYRIARTVDVLLGGPA
jgi:2-dehydropantoate 2-reductase